ncbi:hypothetical protein M3J09_001797 [Ascochyta lentis]
MYRCCTLLAYRAFVFVLCTMALLPGPSLLHSDRGQHAAARLVMLQSYKCMRSVGLGYTLGIGDGRIQLAC